MLTNVISVVATALITRRCCMKKPQNISSSKEENTYEQVEETKPHNISMNENPAYGPLS
jgi:hypothetical protein